MRTPLSWWLRPGTRQTAASTYVGEGPCEWELVVPLYREGRPLGVETINLYLDEKLLTSIEVDYDAWRRPRDQQ